MRDLPFSQLLGRALKISSLILIICVMLYLINFMRPVFLGFIMGIGVGIWCDYFLERRLTRIKITDKVLKHKLQVELMGSLVLRLFTIIAVLFLASRLSTVTLVATAAGVFVVWGVFAAVAAGALLKELRAEGALRKSKS